MPLLARLPARPDKNPTFLQRHLTKLTTVVVVALWGSLGVGLALGGGRLNVLTNTPMAEDLLSLHAAGTIIRTAADRLYDDRMARLVQAATLGPIGREVYNRYMSPPHTALIFAPLSLLPFGLVAWSWSLLSLAALALVPRLLGAARPGLCAVTALTFVPVCDGFAAGQNALFTLFFFALAFWLWQRDQGWLAGLALGAVAVYKPHLIVGPALLFALEIRRDPRPLIALCVVGLALLALDLGCFPAQSHEFLAWGGSVVAGRAPLWGDLRPGGEMTVAGFFALLLPGAPQIARPLGWLCAGVAVVVFVVCHRRLRGRAGPTRAPRAADRTSFACATLLTLWLAPHAHLYEWTLLILPAIVLWRDHGRMPGPLLATFVLSAAIAPCCVRLARAQLSGWGMAVHPAVPTLLLGSIVVLRLVWRWDEKIPV